MEKLNIMTVLESFGVLISKIFNLHNEVTPVAHLIIFYMPV